MRLWKYVIPLLIALVAPNYSAGYFFVYNDDADMDADVVHVSAGASGIFDQVARYKKLVKAAR